MDLAVLWNQGNWLSPQFPFCLQVFCYTNSIKSISPCSASPAPLRANFGRKWCSKHIMTKLQSVFVFPLLKKSITDPHQSVRGDAHLPVLSQAKARRDYSVS